MLTKYAPNPSEYWETCACKILLVRPDLAKLLTDSSGRHTPGVWARHDAIGKSLAQFLGNPHGYQFSTFAQSTRAAIFRMRRQEREQIRQAKAEDKAAPVAQHGEVGFVRYEDNPTERGRALQRALHARIAEIETKQP